MASSEKIAIRPFFAASKKSGCAFYEEDIQFTWYSGLSWQQRQRSSDSMAEAILSKYAASGLRAEEILEISTASHSYELGQQLSALNLQYCDPVTGKTNAVENWFQAGKVFSRDGKVLGPYSELLGVSLPARYLNQKLDAKTASKYAGDPLFERIQSEIAGAKFLRFELGGEQFPLIPRSGFYDYLYVRALNQSQNAELAEGLLQCRVFTDIMFTPGTGSKRKFNTQARSCAIFVSLANRGLLEQALASFEAFVDAVEYPDELEQQSIGETAPLTLF